MSKDLNVCWYCKGTDTKIADTPGGISISCACGGIRAIVLDSRGRTRGTVLAVGDKSDVVVKITSNRPPNE